jgi:copper chaperone CopZ
MAPAYADNLFWATGGGGFDYFPVWCENKREDIMFKNLFLGSGRRGAGALETRRIGIRGMKCKNCEQTIRKALLTKSGVREVQIARETGTATVSFDPAQITLPTLNEVILRKGYFPAPAEEVAGDSSIEAPQPDLAKK